MDIKNQKKIKNLLKVLWIYLKSKRIRNIVKSFLDISKIKKNKKY